MSAPDAAELLDRLSEAFVARLRAGDAPSVAAYAAAHPELAEEIERLFPTLMRMEGFKEDLRQDLEVGDDALGAELGEYRLIREIGRGGMGVVYEAVQETLDRRVALKMLPSNLTRDPRFLERFRQEARAAGRLQHEHIVPVIGIGEHDGIHYFAMQYIEGRGLDEVVRDVRARVERGDPAEGSSEPTLVDQLLGVPLAGSADATGSGTGRPPAPTPAGAPARALSRVWFDNAARLLLQASEGVAAAHARGILHRDIKPSNLMVGHGGKLWITDFGLCKEEGSGDLTRPGDMLGTLRYMPPERLEGESDVQGDVYGLGLTLYELLTLRAAYPGDDHAQLLATIARQAPPRPRQLEPRVPGDLEAIVLKATARDRRVRYATAEALAADLRAYLDGRPIAARPPSFGYHLRSAIRRHRALSATVLVAFLALVASSIYYVTDLQRKEAATRLQSYIANVAAADAAFRGRDVEAARAHLEAAPPELRGWEWHHVRSRFDRSLRATRVQGNRVWDVAYSPDGRWYAATGDGAVHVFDDATAAERFRLDVHGQPVQIAWSPTGDRLAVEAGRGVELWAWPERRRVALVGTAGPNPKLAWSGDGERLVAGADDGMLRAFDRDGSPVLTPLAASSVVKSVAHHPTRPLVATGTGDGHVTLWEIEAGERLWSRRAATYGLHGVAFVGEAFVVTPTEAPHVHLWRVADGRRHRTIGQVHELGSNKVRASRDGRRLVVGTQQSLTAYDVDTWERIVTWYEPRGVRRMSIHPSGARVATTGLGGEVREWGLAFDSDPQLLAGHIDDVSDVAYTPSGSMLVSGGIGVARCWDAETGEQRRVWLAGRWTIVRVAVSADGRTVALGDRMGDVTLVDLATDAVRARLRGHGDWMRGIVFAPDGGRLFVAGQDGTVHAWDLARRARVGTRTDLGRGGSLAIDPRGRRLAVGTEDGWIHVLDPSTLATQRRTKAHDEQVTRLAFGQDGRRLYSCSTDRTLKIWRAADGAHQRTLEGGPMVALAVSPDGTRIAAGGYDAAIRLWDAQSGELVYTRSGLDAYVYSLAFSPDGRQLVAAESAARLRILDTVPLRERMRASRDDLARRQRAKQLVDAMDRGAHDPQRVIAAIQDRTDLAPELAEAALREAHRRLGRPDGLVAWLWRALERPDLDADERSRAWGLAADLHRAAGHRNRPDPRRTTLFGAMRVRVGDHRGAVDHLRRSVQFNRDGDPYLLAVDLAFLALAHARLVERPEAVAALARLETHLARHPTIVDARLAGFRDEARRVVGEMRAR